MTKRMANYPASLLSSNPDPTKQKQLSSALKKLGCSIGHRGLNEEQFGALFEFFITADIENDLRGHIIYCLIPQSVIPNEIIRKGVMWVLRKNITNRTAVVQFLPWLKAVTKFKLVDLSFLRKYYDLLIKILNHETLLKPLCSILKLLTDSSVVTGPNVYIVNSAFKYFTKNSDVKKLLQLMASINPNVVPAEFHRPVTSDSHEPLSDIDTIMKKMALKLQIDWKSKETSLAKKAPLVKKSDDEAVERPEIKNMQDLGRSICRGVGLPQNQLSLLSSQEGIMAIVTLGPSRKFLAELDKQLQVEPDTIIEAVVSLQELLKRGLPPVFRYLSDFLVIWDGFYKEHIVYQLLPWLRFETFEDLKKHIIIPLVRVFVTSEVGVKVKIINSLADLVINLESVELRGVPGHSQDDSDPQWKSDPESTIEAIIDVITSQINTGILLEGVNSNTMIMQGLNVYYKFTKLYKAGNLHRFYAMPELMSFSALCSPNPTLLNELCSMFNMYITEVIPYLENDDSAELYSQEIAMLNGVSDNIYDFIWAAESGVHMSDVSRFHHASALSETIANGSVGRKHLALQIIGKAMEEKLKIDTSKLTRTEFLRILHGCLPDVAKFIELKERTHEQITTENDSTD